MTQAVILKKFVAFANIKQAEQIVEFKKKKKKTRSKAMLKKINASQSVAKKNHGAFIRSLNEGHCFGFTVNFLAHHHFGKRHWWTSVLRKINHWSGKPGTLSRRVYLRDASSNPTHLAI